MGLADYVVAVRERWLLVLAVAAVGLLAAGAASVAVTPQYLAESRAFVSTRLPAQSANDLAQSNAFTQQQVSTYAEIIKTPVVLGPVVEVLGLDATVEELTEAVAAEAVEDTSLITVAVTDPDPQRAAEISNEVVRSFATTLETLESPGDGAPSPVRVTVVQPAVPPPSPESPNTPLNLVVGLLLGSALGVGAAAVRRALETTARTGAPDGLVTAPGSTAAER